LQLFNVMLGGTLYQDLPSEFRSDVYVEHRQKEPPEALTHDVEFTHGSPLRTLLGTDRIAVNSGHHQAICELSTWFECMARSIDGLVEAVYMQVRPFVMAVQWHPECTLYDNNSKLLFKAFVRACGA
jgi:putative glutamine amidotransferase